MTAVRDRELDLDAEQEVDLGRYGRTLAHRWWLPLVGLVAGAVIGYLLSLGGGTVFRAQALIYLGQPLGILGGNQVQGLNTNPSTSRSIVKSESVIRQVAADVGLKPSQLRANVSATPVQGSSAKLAQTQLVLITVKGTKPARIRAAANELAKIVVTQLSGYTNTKIGTLTKQLAADNGAIDATNAALSAPKIDLTAKLFLQLRLTQLQSDATQTTQLLALARNVEAPRIVTRAAAEKTTARSHRNSTVVGALIGLILGGIAALLWDPFLERRARR
jgi:capsular polysaccharide biosynthesis protein